MIFLKLIKYIIIYLLLLFVETNLLHLISIKNITPDLILIFVIIISFREDKSKATVIGFFAGIIQDVFTTNFFGLFALTKSIIGFSGGFLQQPNKKYSFVYNCISFMVLIFIHEFIYQFVFSLGAGIGFFKLLFYYIIPRSLYTLIVVIMMYLIYNPTVARTKIASG